MKNWVQEGKVIELAAPYARAAGEGALVGSIFGVACADLENAESGSFQLEGVFDLAKVSAQAWTLGALIYWDDSAKNATNTSNTGANKLIGVAVAAASNPSSTGRVRLNGAFST